MQINHGMPVKTGTSAVSTSQFHAPIPTARGAPAWPLTDFGGQITALSGTKPSPLLQPSPGPVWREEADVEKFTAPVCLAGLHKQLCWCWQWEGFFGCSRRHLQIPSASQLCCAGWKAYLLCGGAAHQRYKTQPVKSFSFLLGECPPAQEMEKL